MLSAGCNAIAGVNFLRLRRQTPLAVSALFGSTAQHQEKI
jgi:hypothetical protein